MAEVKQEMEASATDTSASATDSTPINTGSAEMTKEVSMQSTTETLAAELSSNDSDTRAGGSSGGKKRKKRPTGVFKCDHEGCDKAFTRAEHLSRHKLNHNPTVIYKCPWDNCSKSFVRSDLRERHVKRHELRKMKDEAKAVSAALNGTKRRRVKKVVERPVSSQPMTPDPSITSIQGHVPISVPHMNGHNANTNTATTDNGLGANKKPLINSLDSIILPNMDDQSPISLHRYDHNTAHVSAARDEANALQHDLSKTAPDSFINHPQLLPRHNHQPLVPQSAPSPARLINWFFDEHTVADTNLADSVPHMSHGNFFNPEDDPFGLSSDLMNDILVMPPNFPSPTQQTDITKDITKKIVQMIPELAGHEHLSQIHEFLESYWACFHTQFPILHKPSFNTHTCPTILLLSMIMIGASYYTSHPSRRLITNPRTFGDLIATPLRNIIFSSHEFQPPAPVWIIQSLLMLEHYERFTTNRVLHERAFVHHGTTIQLLRRSPGFGGNPLNNKTEYEKNQGLTIWEKWIEYEQLKRTALYAFYIDSSHSMVFGYQLMLSTHQIQMRLPCDEELWESYLTPKEIPSKSEQLPFTSALKKLINREYVQTSRFGKKLLLSGLLSIMFQMQQRAIQGTLLEMEDIRDTWQESLSFAFDYWNCEIMNGCCSSSCIYWKDPDQSQLPLSLRQDDTRCKFPVYHMAQITLRIQHYDYYIYSGAPWRMNVEAEASDYELVEKKIKEWSSSHSGRVSVVYAYMFLFEVFLSPQDCSTPYEYKFHSDDDAIHERLNVLALVVILIWAYNYSVEGPESKILLYNPSATNLVCKETGIEYLRRIRNDMSQLVGAKVHLSTPRETLKYHNTMIEIATKLTRIQNKHHMTGLLLMISKLFEENYWEVGGEFSRLVKNCFKRSFGSPKIRCDDMYISSAHRA